MPEELIIARLHSRIIFEHHWAWMEEQSDKAAKAALKLRDLAISQMTSRELLKLRLMSVSLSLAVEREMTTRHIPATDFAGAA